MFWLVDMTISGILSNLLCWYTRPPGWFSFNQIAELSALDLHLCQMTNYPQDYIDAFMFQPQKTRDLYIYIFIYLLLFF